MVARLVRDQEVVGSSPVTSTTKKRRVLPFAFFFHGREPTTSSLLQGSRKSQRSEIFGKRRSGARTRAPPCRGGAREQPTATTRVQVPVTSTTKKRRVLPFAFFFHGREPTTSSLSQGSRKSQRSDIFGKRRSGARTRAPPCRGGARKQPTATTRVQVPSPRPRKSEGFALRFFV